MREIRNIFAFGQHSYRCVCMLDAGWWAWPTKFHAHPQSTEDRTNGLKVGAFVSHRKMVGRLLAQGKICWCFLYFVSPPLRSIRSIRSCSFVPIRRGKTENNITCIMITTFRLQYSLRPQWISEHKFSVIVRILHYSSRRVCEAPGCE